jgi:hypothetical protein
MKKEIEGGKTMAKHCMTPTSHLPDARLLYKSLRTI